MNSPIELVLSKLKRVTGGPDEYKALCPSHNDRSPSLSIAVKDDGRVLLHCHSDKACTLVAICDAMGIATRDLFPEANVVISNRQRSKAKPAKCLDTLIGTVSGKPTRYDYSDTFCVVRYDYNDGSKTYRPFHCNDTGWVMGDPSGLLPLYRLPSLKEARVVWVFEGELCVDAAIALGLCATTSAHGSLSAKKTDWKLLAGKTVNIIPDDDAPGAQYAKTVTKILQKLDCTARVVALPAFDEPGTGLDIVDHIARRRSEGVADDAIRAELEKLASATSAVVDPESSAWEPPLPFDTFQLPSFPLDAFPGRLCALREFCARATESYQVPADVTPLLVLAVGATALAKRIEVQVQPDWVEPVNIFIAVAMESGERKSAIFREVFSPTSRFERSEVERLAPIVEQAAMERAIVEHALKKAKKDAGESKNAVDRIAAKSRAEQLTRELRDAPVLFAPRYTADDATVEAVTRLLFEQGGRIAILSPEGDAFDLMAGRYSANGVPNIGTYLKGHAGDTIRVDRVNKDRPPEHIPSPALTIGLAIQPEVLRGLADNKGFRGRGLLARFLFSLPSSRVGRRELHPRPIPADVARQYAALVHSAMRFGRPDTEETSLRTITVCPEAVIELDRFRESVEHAMKDGGHLAPIRDWALKLPGAVCRIAGIFHGFIHAPAGDPDAHPIDVETISGAISIGEYLTEHALAAFNLMGADPAVAGARRLLKWIIDEGLSEFTRRDAYNRIRTAGAKVWVVDAPLTLLIEHAYIRERATDRDGPGRKPSTTYIVNPYPLTQNPQNAHNSPNQPRQGDSAHCAHSALKGPESPQVESAQVEQLRHFDSETVSSANGGHDVSSSSHNDRSDEDERRAIQSVETEEERAPQPEGDDGPPLNFDFTDSQAAQADNTAWSQQ